MVPQCLVCLVTLVFIGQIDQSIAQISCGAKAQNEIEFLVARITAIGPNGRPLPENFQEVKPFCKETSQLLEKGTRFLKACYRKEMQDIANLIIYSVKSTMRMFCRKRSKKLDALLAATPCFNRHLRPDDGCIMQFVNETKQLIPIKQHNLKIPHTCCSFTRAMQCQEEKIDRIECLRPHKNLMLDFVRSIVQSAVDVMCGEYHEGTDQCERLGKPPKPPRRNRKNYLTYVFVLAELFDSLPKE